MAPSPDPQAGHPPPRKKRAGKACLKCHSRKIRCDVTTHGNPCSNCSFAEAACVVGDNNTTNSRKSPTAHRDKAPLAANLAASASENMFVVRRSLQASNNDSVAVSGPTLNASSRSNSNSVTGKTQPPAGPDQSLHPSLDLPPSSSTSPDCEREHPCDIYLQQLEDLNESIPQRHSSAGLDQLMSDTRLPQEGAAKDDTPSFHLFSTSQGQSRRLGAVVDPSPRRRMTTTSTRSPLHMAVPFGCYSFLETSTPKGLSVDYITYLEAQGCFHLPPTPVLALWLKQYFLHAYPWMPLFTDAPFHSLWRTDAEVVKPDRISLFLFQSILAAASPFIPLASIQDVGFASHWIAQSTFYRRAKLLFDFGMRGDPLNTVQGALLLSHSSPSIAEGTNNNSYWLTMAIQTALSYGFHRPSSHRSFPQKMAWQICLVRDRTLSLCVRRPLQILPICFSYEARLLSPDEVMDHFLRFPGYSAATQRHIAQSFAAMCDLAIVMTDAIMLLYPPDRGPVQSPSSLEEYRNRMSKCQECKNRLSDWFVTISLEFSPTVSTDDDVVMVHVSLLHFHYYTLNIALDHRIMVLSESSPAYAAPERLQTLCHSRDAIRQMCTHILKSLSNLLRRNLLTLLPLTIVGYIIFPLVLHLVNAKLAVDKTRKASAGKELNVFLCALKLLGEHHDHAGFAAWISTKCLQYFCRAKPALPVDPKSGLPLSRDWTELSIDQPAFYFRLAAYVDLSLSQGRPPQEHEQVEYLQISPTQNNNDGPAENADEQNVGSGRVSAAASGMVESALSSFLPPIELDGLLLPDWDDGRGDFNRANYDWGPVDLGH